MASADPIQQIYNQLWLHVEDDATLAAMVKAANRLKFTGSNQNPVRENPTDADLPELALFERELTPNRVGDGTTSHSVAIAVRFDFALTTAHLRLDDDSGINAILWRLIRIIETAAPTMAGMTLTDPVDGVTVIGAVKNLRYGAGIIQTADPTFIERALRGWKLVLPVEVVAVFTRALIVL